MLTLSLALVIVAKPQDNLQVNPLLVSQAAEVWSLVARRDNSIWPGWDASKTPLLIYLPGKQDLLINHPKPPQGFKPYEGPIRFPGGRMLIKDGPTIIKMDGQNTALEIEGVQTLVVADTLSNLRQQLQSVVDQARSGQEDVTDNITGSIQPSPYDSMLMFAHEAFHVYQRQRAPGKGGNELALTKYPSLSVKNNTGYALESEALVEALRTTEPASLRKAALKWLAIRQDRRLELTKEAVAYEDGTEFNEGLAKYVEYKALEVFQGRKPGHDMWLIQGFRGYSDLNTVRLKLQDRMRSMMSGRSNINNDLYGASPVRMRLYFSGMGVSALLDKLGAKWHDAILKPQTTLTTLATETLRATPEELKAAMGEVLASSRHKELQAEKQKLEIDGKAHIQETLAGFDKAPAKIVLDYSALSNPKVGFSFTPFGILSIDDQRAIYRLIPLQGLIGPLTFSETTARPLLHDQSKKEVVLTTTDPIDEPALDRALGTSDWRKGPIAVDNIKLPGIALNGGKAVFQLDGKTLRVKLAD